jgi:hypothetical protein
MCGPKTIFSTLKLIMRPEQRFEFDMPAIDDTFLFQQHSWSGEEHLGFQLYLNHNYLNSHMKSFYLKKIHSGMKIPKWEKNGECRSIPYFRINKVIKIVNFFGVFFSFWNCCVQCLRGSLVQCHSEQKF